MKRSSAALVTALRVPPVPVLLVLQKLLVPFHAPTTVLYPVVLPFTSQYNEVAKTHGAVSMIANKLLPEQTSRERNPKEILINT